MNASELIDKRIEELDDWRGKRIARIRQLVREAVPEIVEEYTRGQWRELISLPLNFKKEQKDMFVNATLEHYWSYKGR